MGNDDESWVEHANELDAAINAIDDDGFITTGWVVVRVCASLDLEKGEAGYAYYVPPTQPIHITRGLLAMAHTNFDERCRSALHD